MLATPSAVITRISFAEQVGIAGNHLQGTAVEIERAGSRDSTPLGVTGDGRGGQGTTVSN